jgi:putative FmdB family regulatory protein
MPNALSRSAESPNQSRRRATLSLQEDAVPLYEYVCRKCSKQFETLIFGADVPACPACQSAEVERILSVVSVGRSEPASEPSACGSCPGRGGPGCGMN